ncbi:MAG: hypothetical protein ACREE7_04115, partial [Dongiaceae bacterium]
MKTILLSACAAALIAAAAPSASAGQFTMNDNGPSGPIIGVGDNRYYDDNGYNGNDWRYPSPGYGDEDSDYSYGNRGYGNQGYGYGNQGYGNGYGNGGYGYGYGNYGVVPPHVIVRRLHRSGFSYISRPALAGRFYQVKARDPNGRKVKLYI